MINKMKIKNRGFSMLESIVAIMVLSLSVSGAFSAVTQSLSQATIAKDEIKAFYLAQEAIEIIRNKRDANQLFKMANPATLNTWLYGIAQDAVNDPCRFGEICQANATTNPPSLTHCSSSWGNCDYLKQTTDTFRYNYATGDTTNFKREIQIESITADEISVTVLISWTKGPLSSFQFKVKTHLFNWVSTP